MGTRTILGRRQRSEERLLNVSIHERSVLELTVPNPTRQKLPTKPAHFCPDRGRLHFERVSLWMAFVILHRGLVGRIPLQPVGASRQW